MSTTDKENKKRKKARSVFLDYYKRLSNACGTFDDIDEWYEHVNELKDLLFEYAQFIPLDARKQLEDATNLVDNTRSGIRLACRALTRDLQGVIEDYLPEIIERIPGERDSEDSGHRLESTIRNEATKRVLSKSVIGGIIGGIVVIAAVSAYIFTQEQFDFELQSQTHEDTILSKQTTSFQISIYLISGDAKKVDLSCTPVTNSPITCKLSQYSAYAGETVTATIEAGDVSTPDTYSLEVSGIGENTQHSIFLDVTVNPSPHLKISAENPKNNAIVFSKPVNFSVKITNDDTPVKGANVEFFLNNNLIASALSDAKGFAKTSTSQVPFGENRWYVIATKQGYDPKSLPTYIFTMADEENPTISISSHLDGSSITTVNTRLSGKATDIGSGINMVEVKVVDSPYLKAQGTTSWFIDITLTEGPNVIYAKVTDNEGNSEIISISVTVDTTNPIVNGQPARLFDHNDWFNHSVTIVWAAQFENNIGCDPPTIYEGPDTIATNLMGSCTDDAGNGATGSYAIKYDATNPDTTITQVLDQDDTNISNGGSTTSSFVRFFFSGTDLTSGIEGYECSLDETMYSTCVNGYIVKFSQGNHTLQVRAQDNAGNIDLKPATFSWTFYSIIE